MSSRLYNYFVSCWQYNPDFTEANLDNAVSKGLLTSDEKTAIMAMPRYV